MQEGEGGQEEKEATKIEEANDLTQQAANETPAPVAPQVQAPPQAPAAPEVPAGPSSAAAAAALAAGGVHPVHPVSTNCTPKAVLCL